MNLLKNKWEEFAPNQTFDYSFLENRFNSLYLQEYRIGKIMIAFTILAIVIASLGLFGLSAYMTEKRTKEIGIRKVNGASISNIYILLFKDISKLILVSFLLAVPLAWYFMDNWLNNFAYRIQINWSTFLVAGIISITLALITIFYQTYKAAVRNPVDFLRHV